MQRVSKINFDRVYEKIGRVITDWPRSDFQLLFLYIIVSNYYFYTFLVLHITPVIVEYRYI